MALNHRDGLATLWSLALAVLALAYPFVLGAGAWLWIMGPVLRTLGLGI
jgi:hypothetical protein